jgi:hypothetical protein
MDQPYFIPLYLLTVFFFTFFDTGGKEIIQRLESCWSVLARQNWSKSPNPVRMTTALRLRHD